MNKMNNPAALGTEKIPKLLSYYAIPASITMIATSLYNIADSIFIGRGVGPYAISGLAVSFPFMIIALALGLLVGVGSASLISIKLGQKDFHAAERILVHLIYLSLFFGGLFTITGLIFLDPILKLFGAGPQTLPYARDYMFVIMIGTIITHIYFGLASLLRSTGQPKLSMNITIMTIFLNCGLNALFIFVFKWGIKGAAIATVISQFVGLMIEVYVYSSKKSVIHFSKAALKFDIGLSKEIISIGMAPFALHVASCFIVIFINNTLKKLGGELSIGAYGILNRLSMLFFMVVTGIAQGMQPIAGYNYGAQQYDRVKAVVNLSAKLSTIVMSIGFFIFILFPRTVASIFTDSEELLDISAEGIRYASLMLPVIGFSIIISIFFQSIGKPKQAIFMSLTRQVIFLLPLLFILPRIMHTMGVWLSFPISDAIAAILAVIMYKRQLKQFELL